MSTNFYWTPPKGHELEVFGRIHVGKRAGGWAFSFHGYRFPGSPAQSGTHEVAPGLNLQTSLPAAPPLHIESWQDWKRLIYLKGSELHNEYDDPVSPDEFSEEVETALHPRKGSWGPERRPLLNHVPYGKARYTGKSFTDFHDTSKNWQDEEEFSFTASDFS